MMATRCLAAASLLLLLTSAACSRIKVPTEPVAPEQIISVARTDAGAVPADGVSTASFQAVIPAESTVRTITFKASAGSFRGGTDSIAVNSDTQGHAAAVLVSPLSPGTATITASVTAASTTYSGSTSVAFVNANPDALAGEISTTTAALDGSTKPTISVFATRRTGKVSVGTPITFTATQTTTDGTHTVGRFTGTDTMRTDANGKASATFVADTGDVKAGVPVAIRASTSNDAGSPVVFDVTIAVK